MIASTGGSSAAFLFFLWGRGATSAEDDNVAWGGAAGDDTLAARAFLGAGPPVDFPAVCLVRAMGVRSRRDWVGTPHPRRDIHVHFAIGYQVASGLHGQRVHV